MHDNRPKVPNSHVGRRIKQAPTQQAEQYHGLIRNSNVAPRSAGDAATPAYERLSHGTQINLRASRTPNKL